MLNRGLIACLFITLPVWPQAGPPEAQVQKPGAEDTRGAGERETAAGSLEGRLVAEQEGAPIAGMTVLLYGDASHEARTDAEGRFRMEGLAPGRYSLRLVTGSEFAATRLSVRLRAGQQHAPVVLRARKSGAVAGRVLDPERRPIAGAAVWLLAGGAGTDKYLPGRLGSGKTNDRGEYRITGVEPDRYTLLAEPRRPALRITSPNEQDKEPEPDVTPGLGPTYYPNAVFRSGAVSFAVESGQVAENIDVEVPMRDTMCVQSAGRLTSQNPGASIRVMVHAPLYLGGALLARSQLASANGLELCGLSSGEYRLIASTEGDASSAVHAVAAFSLAKRSVRLPSLSLSPLTPLAGRLIVESDSDDKPQLKGMVTVRLRAEGRSRIPGETAQIVVKGEGPFSIPAVAPDEYWLEVRAPEGFYVKSANLGGTDVLHYPLHPSGSELIIVLGRDGPTLAVQAIDENGKGVSSATVILGRDPEPERYFPEIVTLNVEEDGQVTFSGIAPGAYRVLAYRAISGEKSMRPAFFRSNQQHGEAVTLNPRESRSLRVRVLEAP